MSGIDRERMRELPDLLDEVCAEGGALVIEGAEALRQALAALAAAEAREAKLRAALELNARHADGIRGAVETNQVADKDVRGVAIMIRDRARAALTDKGDTDHDG